MKELALYNLKEGMVLAKDITTPSGQVVLEKGKELTKQSILRLSFYNIKSACIVDGEEKQAAPKSYSQKIKTSQKFQSFQVDHTIVLSQIRVSFEGYVNEGKPLDTSALLSKVVELFQSCKTSLELFNMVHNMHSSDDSVYVQSLNVSLICRQIGKWIKADDATLDMLTIFFLGHLDGLGIGTILAAFTMGKVIGAIGKWMDGRLRFVSVLTPKTAKPC